MKAPSNGFSGNPGEGEGKNINSELWHACAGPLVSLPPAGSLVVYFPQGHSEQVAASMQKDTDSIPNYPSLPSKLICVLHNVTLHADAETDEVYAEMTLQPVTKCDREALLASDLGLKQNKQPADFFCKTLTASDTSTHGGFSVPRRAAEKIFPPLDFSMQPPAQELTAKDLHDVSWTFRHIYRGQPKRHLLTTGWSVFVSTKRLLAGDSVLFVRDEKSQHLLGIRRAVRQQPALSSSVLSSDSMHIGILAAAAHAAANNSPFTIFYNPRATPSEFVIPLAKYYKAMYTQVSVGMRFRMMFETEESGIRRYMGTITGISDLDSVRWKNSQWRNLQVGWDESTAGERRSRVSVWEIEPVATPFYLCPPFFRSKFPRELGMPDDGSEVENAFKQMMPWLNNDSIGLKDVQSPIFTGLNLAQWINMQQNPQFIASAAQSGLFPSMVASAFQNSLGTDDASRLLNFQSQSLPLSNLQFNIPKPTQQVQLLDQFQQTSLMLPQAQLQQQALPHPQQQQQQQPPQVQQNAALPQQQQPAPHQLQQQQLPLTQQQPSQAMPLRVQHQQQQDQSLSASLLKQQQHILQQQQQTLIHQQQHQQPQLTIIQPQKVQQMQQQQQQQQQQLQHNQIRPVNTNLGIFDQQQKQYQPFASQSLPQSQQLSNQILLSPQSQLQQQSFPIPNAQTQQNMYLPNQNPPQPAVSLPHSLQLQQQLEQQQLVSQRQHQQMQQIQMSQPQLQLQLLQKLQQQHVLSQLSPHLQPQLSQQQQLPPPPNQQFLQQQLQQEQPNGKLLSPTSPKQHQFPIQGKSQLKSHPSFKDQSMLPQHETASMLTSPTSNSSLVSPRNLLGKNPQGPVVLHGETTSQPMNNLVHELQKELHSMKETEHHAYRHGINDHLDASSSATSFCLDGSAQESLSLPPLCLDSDVQVEHRSNHSFGTNIGLSPDTLLSKSFGSGKDLHNLLAAYGNHKDIEPEMSTAAISSQSFGLPNIPFKPGSSGETAANENGVLNRGMWSSQQQRMRTYTKVQKRGSVGRCIDVTRYKGYDELRHDLACMFGIEGQLEDLHMTDWKLVYVDHENDILLVGDDPWEEFVSCVQSIKILSSVEVQQMSLDGDLVNVPVQNPACSGSDNGNMWKGHYDDHSAASFDH